MARRRNSGFAGACIVDLLQHFEIAKAQKGFAEAETVWHSYVAGTHIRLLNKAL
jgi:hypothetical protein